MRWATPVWLLFCAVVPLTLALAGDTSRPDPLPLRRVLIGPERVATELERAQKGILALLPRAEFEAKVQEAALAVELAGNPPRLLKTIYTAQLVDQSLTGGAEWSVLHTAPGPGLLPLIDLNLALGKRFQVDGANATSGELDGKTPSLWIDKPGAASVYFDWSRQGVVAQDGLHFDLEVPACANAHLELTLPADRLVSAGKPGILVSGPQETGDPTQHKWKLSFAGRTRLEFVVRRLQGDGPGGPVMLATVQTRQELGPDRLLADFDFQIEALHGSVVQMVFACDAPLLPYDVSLVGADLKSWHWRPPGPEPRAHGQLTVGLKEPHQGLLPLLRVRCLAPTVKNKMDAAWASPGVRLVGAVSRGETLRLHVLPEAQLESWKPGHFRLVKLLTEPDGTRVLTLFHAGIALPRPPAALAEGGPDLAYSAALGAQLPPLQRPSAVVRAKACEFLAQHRTWWQIDKNHSTLTTEIECRPMRGQLFHLPLKMPANSQVEQISVEPKEMLRGWVPSGTQQNPLLMIDLAQPATLQTPVKIKLRLRVLHTRPPASAPLVLPFVDVEPLVPCLREGALAISIHPQWRAELLKTSTSASAVTPDGPWQPALTDYFFTFRGKALAGLLSLEPRAPELKARCQSDVLLAGSRGTLITRLTLEPSGGSIEHVDLLLSAPLADTWKVRTEGPAPRIAAVQRLAGLDTMAALLLLGSHHGLEALTVLAAQPGRQLWRVSFAEPVSSRIHLVLVSGFTPTEPWAQAGSNGQRTWSIPLVSVAGAQPFTGADDLLAVQVLGAEIVGADAEKLQELPLPGGGVGKTSPKAHGQKRLWRVYRYTGPRPHLIVQARGVAVGEEPETPETCESAALVTYVEPGGRLVHHFKFQLRNWRKSAVPVLLPPGAQMILASTEGRSLDTFSQQELPGGVKVDLPATNALGVQHFELVYVTSDGLRQWWPCQRLPAPLPQLPVKPLEFRRSWVLPLGVVPLDDSLVRLAQRPNEPAGTSPALSLEPLWTIGQPLLASFLDESATPPWATVQRQHLTTALGQLPKAAKTWSLGQVVEWLVFDRLKHQVPLIVDAAALAAAGLTPKTPFAGADLPQTESKAPLVFVPTPSGLLLTTREQWQFWGVQATASIVVSGAVADAVLEAAQRGHDTSGRFWSSARWLRVPAPPSMGATLAELSLMGGRFTPEGAGGRWTQWETSAGVQGPESLQVVRPLGGHVLGVALALAWWFLAWCLCKRWSYLWRTRLLLTWLVLLLVAALWLPAPLRPVVLWPAGAAAAVALFWYCCTIGAAARSPVPPSSSPTPRLPSRAPAGAVIAGLLLLAGLALPAVWSQGTDVNTVLVLPGPPEAPQRQYVLVNPELLKTLKAMVKKSPATLQGAVLTSAGYEGTVSGELALFKAEFQVHSFDNKATLTIPLAGVELREGALLDGAPVQPTAAQAGYTIAVKDKGPHQLTLFFSVRLQSTPEHRDLRFTIPRLHQSSLQLQTPAEQPQWQVLSGVGQSSNLSVTGQNRRVLIDLGRAGTIHLRCPQTGPAAPVAKITVREAYFWDLRGPASECTGILQYQVSAGSTDHLVLALPETLEPRSVEVTGEGDPDEAGRPRLKSWHVSAAKGQWRLHVWLQAPVSGKVRLTLRLLPRQPFAATAVRLQLPLPLDAQLGDGIMGYRMDHPNPKDNGINFQGIFLKPDLFANQWPGVRVEPSRAYSFDKHNADSTLLVTLPPARPTFEQDLHWTVHPDHAEIAATMKATAAGDEPTLMLIEWEVPPGVTVAEITGDNVRSWSRAAAPADPRIQVWLKQPARTATLQLRGWTGYQKPPPGQPQRWIVPVLRCPDGVNAWTLLHISETPAVRVEADAKKFQSLVPLPQTSLSWTCKLLQGVYRAEFLLRPVAPPPQVLGLTSLEVRDGVVQLTNVLQVHLDHGGAASFFVHAGQWPGSLLKLEGPGVVRIRRSPGGEQHWQIQVPATAPRRLILKLTGSLPAATGLHFDLPKIALEQATWIDHWVAASASGLQVHALGGLTAVKDTRALPDFVLERLGKQAALWKAAPEGWRLSLGVVTPSAAPNVLVLHAEQKAAFGEAFGWIHQLALVLYVKESLDVTIDMPAGALQPTATIDGETVTPRIVGPDQIVLTLPAGDGVRELRLRWVFGGAGETVAQPKLLTPRLVGLPAQPMFWTVTLPAGYRLQNEADTLDTLPPLAAVKVHQARAQAMATASELLAERWGKSPADNIKNQLLACQKQFFRHYRLATLLLDSPADIPDAALRTQLKQQLAALQKHNADTLHKAGLDTVRAKVEKSVAIADREFEVFALPARGKVLRWQTGASSAPPELKLAIAGLDAHDRAWAQTRTLLLAFAVLIGITWVPGMAASVRRFWPEQIAAVAVLGWYLAGFSPLALVLLLVAGAGRAWLFATWARARRVAEPKAST
jgi:hypothetical protein